MIENIDYEKLKYDLINYFGSAMPIMPMSMINLMEVENASPQKLIEIANKNGFNLNDYIQKNQKYK